MLRRPNCFSKAGSKFLFNFDFGIGEIRPVNLRLVEEHYTVESPRINVSAFADGAGSRRIGVPPVLKKFHHAPPLV